MQINKNIYLLIYEIHLVSLWSLICLCFCSPEFSDQNLSIICCYLSFGRGCCRHKLFTFSSSCSESLGQLQTWHKALLGKGDSMLFKRRATLTTKERSFLINQNLLVFLKNLLLWNHSVRKAELLVWKYPKVV